MKDLTFATSTKDPWCHGCGHTTVARSMQRVLAKHFNPMNVILVTDIGCIGMADSMFTCHTVHGLHGRAPAVGSGIAMSLRDPSQKVIVLMGDGGAAIGLQHILECARLNVDMTLILCDNQNYAMTGGQCSAYTMPGVKTSTSPEGGTLANYPLIEMMKDLGVAHAQTLATSKDLEGYLDTCIQHRGFSLVRTFNYCPSYSGKMNLETLGPKQMPQFLESRGVPFGFWPATRKTAAYRFVSAPEKLVLTGSKPKFRHSLDGNLKILLAGSAGEGVQNAAEVFAKAAMSSGLDVALSSEYPVTVGKGFSCSFLQISSAPILSTAQENWDLAMVVSQEGMKYVESRNPSVHSMVVDESVEASATPTERMNFRSSDGKQAAFAALLWMARKKEILPMEALRDAVNAMKSKKAKQSYLTMLE